jgi:hypothetical protein
MIRRLILLLLTQLAALGAVAGAQTSQAPSITAPVLEILYPPPNAASVPAAAVPYSVTAAPLSITYPEPAAASTTSHPMFTVTADALEILFPAPLPAPPK